MSIRSSEDYNGTRGPRGGEEISRQGFQKRIEKIKTYNPQGGATSATLYSITTRTSAPADASPCAPSSMPSARRRGS